MFANFYSIILIASIAAGFLGLVLIILGIVFFVLNSKANAKYREQAANNSVPELPKRELAPDVPPSSPVTGDVDATMSLYSAPAAADGGEGTVMLFGQQKRTATYVKMVYSGTDPGLQGEYKAVINGSVSVGRKEGDIVISIDNSISSRHCEFIKREAQYFVRDLGSSNGTKLNGNPVSATEVPIKTGDTVRIGRGDYVVIFEEE